MFYVLNIVVEHECIMLLPISRLMTFRKANHKIIHGLIRYQTVLLQVYFETHKRVPSIASLAWQQGPYGQHGAHLVPTGPTWAPCWPHELPHVGPWILLSGIQINTCLTGNACLYGHTCQIKYKCHIPHDPLYTNWYITCVPCISHLHERWVREQHIQLTQYVSL